jgi:hypothetical protein
VSLTLLIGQIAVNCLHAGCAICTPGTTRVNPLVKLLPGLGLVVACLVFVCRRAATSAEQLIHQAQKAEHDGEIVKAYVLYAEAAAADPTNIDYWDRAQALRPAASLMDASPPKPPEFPSDKIDRRLFGHIGERIWKRRASRLPPAQLQAEPGRRDYDLPGRLQGALGTGGRYAAPESSVRRRLQAHPRVPF